jgi:two-component system chemotaxis response regulator CheY
MKDKHEVLVVDDEPSRRAVIIELTDSQPEFKVVGEAENGEVGFKLYMDTNPDIVITDDVMPGGSGLEMISGIRSVDPNAKILLHSARTDEAAVRERRTYQIQAALIYPFSDKEFLDILRMIAGVEAS